jgi:hypothetical protein
MQMLTTRFAKTLGIGLAAGAAMTVMPMSPRAADQISPPPYLVTGLNGVGINVVWDEATVRKALPHGIEPVKAMTGGINIYSVERGNVVAPYSAAYFYVDVEGFDSPDGIKGRWMLAGAYGPDPKTSEAIKQYNGMPVRPGSSRIESSADGKHAVGTVNGHDFITADLKPVPGSCQPAAVRLNYVALAPQAEQPEVTHIPFVGEICKAEAASAKIIAPSGDPFAAFSIAKVTGASETKNGAATFTAPQPGSK